MPPTDTFQFEVENLPDHNSQGELDESFDQEEISSTQQLIVHYKVISLLISQVPANLLTIYYNMEMNKIQVINILKSPHLKVESF